MFGETWLHYTKANSKVPSRFVKDNTKLGKEADRLSKVAVEIAKKPYQTDEDLRRFDLVQNKTIKTNEKLLLYAGSSKGNLYITGWSCR